MPVTEFRNGGVIYEFRRLKEGSNRMKKQAKRIIARIMTVLMIVSVMPLDTWGSVNVVMAEELENGVEMKSMLDDEGNTGNIDNDGLVSVGGIQDNEDEPDGTGSTDGSNVTEDKDPDNSDGSNESGNSGDSNDSDDPNDSENSDNGDDSNGSETTDNEDGDKEDETTDPSSDDVNNNEETAEPSKDENSGEQTEAKTYILDPENLETATLTTATTYGTDNFFTVMCTSNKSAAISNIASITTGDDAHLAYNPLNWGDYANEKLGGSAIANSARTKCIKITNGKMNISSGAAFACVKIVTKYPNAKLVVYASPKANSAGIAVKTKSGSSFTDAYTGSSSSNPKVARSEITIGVAGEYYVGFGAEGGAILYMEVTDDPNAKEPEPGAGNTGGITFTYDEPVMGVKTDIVSFINKSGESAGADVEEVSVENVHLKVESLEATSNIITADIKTAVQAQCTKLMAESDNKDAGAEPIVSYYDMSLINNDAGADKSELQINEGKIKFKLPYPENVGLTNKIVVLHDKDLIGEVERANKDDDGFWVEADSFSPYTIIIEPTETAKEGKIELTDYNGYAEGAYVEWKPYTTTPQHSGYMVAVSQDKTKWDYIDDKLIRKYQNYFRADALGLTEGIWYMKVEAVNIGSDQKATPVAVNTVKLNVKAHDRSGYAWVNGTSSGAYNEDGSLIPTANVVYITETTKDTVQLNVTGATTNPCVGIQGILDGYKKGKETKPLDIRIIGNVTNAKYLLSDDIVIENKNSGNSGMGGITVEGVGEDAVANGWGIRVKSASNVEIRNLGFMNRSSTGEKDNVGLQQDNDHVWVHNCDLFYGNAGSDADQIKGDGAMDCKKSNYVTFSYNHFWDSGKCCLLGLSEGTNDLHITYHHNWFDHSDSRHPRIRYFTTHVYNNYYDGNAKYGVGGAKGQASIFVENNYFRNCKYPMLISMQGSDLWDEGKQQNVDANGTFSSEDGSIIKAYGNIMVGQKRFIPYSATDDTNTVYDETKDFDAYVASSRDEPVPSTVKAARGGGTYNNFDTAADFYKYTPDAAADVPEIVRRNAGRVNGGDFKWTFDNATADTSYAVDMNLKNKCLNYKSELVSVGGLNGATVNIEYIVTFDPNNSDEPWEVTVQGGNPVARPATDPASSDANKTFDGWYKGNAKWNFSNVVSGNMTLTAIYLGEDENPPGTGGGDGDDIGDNTGDDDNNNVNSGDYVHNFTEKGKESTFYTINGNLSTGKGSVTYKGLTLTQCLKMEKNTSISIKDSVPAEGTLTLVFGGSDSAAGKKVKINGTDKVCDTNGIYTQDVEEDDNIVITKGDSINLFYIEYIPEGYNITIDKDDGSANKTIIISKGSELTEKQLPDPVKAGYKFDGWVDAETGDKIKLPITPQKDMTIRATWIKDDGGDPGPGPGPSGKYSWTVVMKQKTYTYTGTAIKPGVTVYDHKGDELVEGVDYTVKYSNNLKASVVKNNGNYENIDKSGKKLPTVTVSGKGILSGKYTDNFVIKPKDISNVSDKEIQAAEIRIEKGKKASAPVICYNGVKLGAKDYNIKADGKTKTFSADGTIEIEGLGNYEGTRSITVKVFNNKNDLKAAVNKFTVDIDKEEVSKLIYNGKPQDIAYCISAIKPTSGTDKGKDIRTQTGKYTVVLPNNVTDVGTVKFMVVGLDDYSGCTVSKSVKIQPMALDESKVEIEGVPSTGVDYNNTGAVVSGLSIKVKGQTEPLVNGRDYKLSYSNNKKVGDANFTVAFKGNYKGKIAKTAKTTFKINKATLDKTNATVELPDKVCKENANCKSTPYVTVNGVLVKASEYEVQYYVGGSTTPTDKPKVTFGSNNRVTVSVKIKAKAKSNNYKVAEAGNEITGSYTVWKKGSSNDKDLSKAKVTFHNQADCKDRKVTKFEYNGGEVKPGGINVIIGNNTTNLYSQDAAKSQVTVTYVNNVNKGKATVIIKPAEGSGLIGSKVVTFSIASKNASGLSRSVLEKISNTINNIFK